MEREANYIAVGSFVLLVLVMGVLFVYWYSAANHQGTYKRYEIYLDGSVSGLSVGSPVRYLGVDVGQVESIRIDPRSADRVQVIADIAPSAPLSSRTVARLSVQGLTGVMYIDLRQRAGSTAPQPLAPGEKYPVIASEQSNLDVLLNSLPNLAARLEEVADRAARLLSDQNIDAAQRIAAHLDQATAGLPQTLSSVNQLIAQLRATTLEADQVLSDVRATTQSARVDISTAVQNLRITSDNLARSSARLDEFMAANGPLLSDLVRDGVPQLEGLLRDSRSAIRQIDELARSLSANPSGLLYQPPRAGISIPP